jgi:serine/threonine-protein kinase
MGYVFRAWDGRLHREVALKLLHNEYAMPGMRERFLREARAASALNHPNICTIFDIGEQDGEPYLVMELLEGFTLKDKIQSGPLSLDEMLCIGREMAEALGAAHAKGVIHRDVKPANIFLVRKPNGSFQAKMLDFGLAKIEGGVLGARGSRHLDITSAGATVGTLAYMSPEQARGETLDSRSDLFSLGVVMYEMATQQIPFPGATSALVFVKLLNQPPEPVRDFNEAIPRELERVIFKLMAKERSSRFQTAHELELALKQIEERGPGGSNWLRKAVSASALGFGADNATKSRKTSRRAESQPEERQPADLLPRQPSAAATRTPTPPAEMQFLRPVARIPRGETPRPSGSALSSKTVPAAASSASAPLEVPALEGRSVTPVPLDNRPSDASGTEEPRRLRPSSPFVAIDAFDELERVEERKAASSKSVIASPASPPSPGTEPRFRLPFIVSTRLVVGVLIVLAVGAISTVFFLQRGHLGPTMLTERDPVVLTEIENNTGDKVLDGSLTEALDFALHQSPYLMLRSRFAYRMARMQAQAEDASTASGQGLARAVAHRLGARAYLYGSIANVSAPYDLHVDLIDTESNDVMSSVDQQMASLTQFPSAIDRVAGAIRANAGEDSDSVARVNAPLAQESTTSLEALEEFAQGEDAASSGRTLEALRLYQQAATADPRFIEAQLRLTTLYRKLRAEVAAADAARLAMAAADHASERIRSYAQYEYEMNTSGDYARATSIMRRLLTLYPHDSQAMERLSRALRLQGHLSEALQAAQQAYAEDPLNADAYTQAENALIGLDRYDAAYQLQLEAQRRGIDRAGAALSAAYLDGRTAVVESALAALDASEEDQTKYTPDWNHGIYLDNIGQLRAGANLWRVRAAAAEQVPGLKSAASFLLAQGALDRALLGECGNALEMAHQAGALPGGILAVFHQGMAEALCGDATGAETAIQSLDSNYPQSFIVSGFATADIQAALALRASHPESALELLKDARKYDLISLTPYLRGRAHVALHQEQVGIVDYQTVLAHHGVTFEVGNDVYPAAEIGVARAFAATGDQYNSAEAYRRFLTLWQDAEPGQPLLAEARAHTR